MSELATELITQAIATRAPLPQTTAFGPKRSIKYPPMGCAHVSVTMKIVKAT
jgi:hypothetical protein